MSDPSATPAPADDTPDGAANPEQALGGVWHLLDVLPRSSASPALAATTVEMAAVSVRGATEKAARRRGVVWGWVLPGLAVLGGLGTGVFAGRMSSPDPDRRALEYLPVIRHLVPLREAGSADFLDDVAARSYPAPRRFGPFVRPGDGRAGEPRGAEPPAEGAPAAEPTPAEVPVPAELQAAIAALPGEPLGPDTPVDVLARRRAEVEALDPDERRRLADLVSTFMTLPEVARHDVIELARLLADDAPATEQRRQRIRAAAATWHQYVSLRDPAERSDVVDLSREERLESLDRFYTRFIFRGSREWDRDGRRGFGGARPGDTQAPGAEPPPVGRERDRGATGRGAGGGAGDTPSGPQRPESARGDGPPGRSALGGFRSGLPGPGARPGTPPPPR